MTVEEFYPIYQIKQNICIDSRKAQTGSVFIGIKGDNFDGNDFAELALENGCDWAIIDNPNIRSHKNIILVDDSLLFLQNLAGYHRQQLNIPVIGISGTNGKTTTKELITAILSTKYQVIATLGNLNNHIGVPLTILRARKDTEILIVEMGANHLGEIRLLSEIARPTHGLLTNIGRAHLEGFGSFEGVISAKNELYDYLISNKGTVFVNQEDELLLGLLKGYAAISYGNGEKTAVKYDIVPGFMLSFKLDLNEIGVSKQFVINTKLVGNYNLSNALAALAIGNHFGIEWESACKAISEYSPGMNRSEYRETNNNKLILDAYNANPNSMIEALNNFELIESANKLAILGDMLELGQYSSQLHSEILEKAINQNFEIILVGEEFNNIAHKYSMKAYLSVDELLNWMKDLKIEGKTILLKGSRGIQLEKLVPYL